VKNKLREIYKLTDKLFPGISNFCKSCDTCCKTYGWLLKRETKNFLNRGFKIVKINNSIYCLDSFETNERGKRIIEKIPRCIFYKNKKCSIYKDRPLDCRFYPIKIKPKGKNLIVGLSLGCKYISSLSVSQRNKICKNIINFFIKNHEDYIVKEYLNLIYNINLISKPKRFKFLRLFEIKKPDTI